MYHLLKEGFNLEETSQLQVIREGTISAFFGFTKTKRNHEEKKRKFKVKTDEISRLQSWKPLQVLVCLYVD
jgi:hypothetical protein